MTSLVESSTSNAPTLRLTRPPEDPEIVVISDLHIGLGKNPRTGRYYALEAFFYDDDFERFCRYICADAAARNVRFRLILNGDVFDLLRVEPFDNRVRKRLRTRRVFAAQTPQTAARTVVRIMAGHPGFVRGLAHVLQHADDVVLLPGNHDLEIQWPSVQAQIRRVLIGQVRQMAGDAAAEAAERRLHFRPWFYYEPGRIWIEHGCQYDPENSFRYLLRGGCDRMPSSVHRAEYDMPLGNFFQRYLYNDFGHITFIVPSTRANARYLKWLLINEPRMLLHVVASHAPFVFQVLRRLARYAGPARRAFRTTHEAELKVLAEESGLGARLAAIDSYKERRADTVQAIRGWLWQLVKATFFGAGFTLVSFFFWLLGIEGINEMRVGVWSRAAIFLAFNVIMLTSVVAGIGYALLRNPPSVPSRPLRRAAQRIINTLDVPIVCFGHTHDEEISALRRKAISRAWYYNTGTWIAVFTHDVLMPRERVQYTFLRVQGQQAELLQWSPGRGEPLPVVLLEEHWRPPRMREELEENNPS